MVEYVCNNCNYRFEPKEQKQGQEKKMCPYCGEPKLIREAGAQALLDLD